MRSRFKYQCDECGWTGYFSQSEFARKARPRCQSCGSTLLEPVTQLAKERIMEHGARLAESRARSMVKRNFNRAKKWREGATR